MIARDTGKTSVCPTEHQHRIPANLIKQVISPIEHQLNLKKLHRASTQNFRKPYKTRHITHRASTFRTYTQVDALWEKMGGFSAENWGIGRTIFNSSIDRLKPWSG